MASDTCSFPVKVCQFDDAALALGSVKCYWECADARNRRTSSLSTVVPSDMDHLSDDDCDLLPVEVKDIALSGAASTRPRRIISWGCVEIITYVADPNTAGTPATKSSPGQDAATTVVIQKLPKKWNRDMLLTLLDLQGFRGQYDFVYLPIDRRSYQSLGFAFVNFYSNAAAKSAIGRFSCVFEARWSEKRQCLRDHIEHFRDAPLMGADVPDACKPIHLVNGSRVDFPTGP